MKISSTLFIVYCKYLKIDVEYVLSKYKEFSITNSPKYKKIKENKALKGT